MTDSVWISLKIVIKEDIEIEESLQVIGTVTAEYIFFIFVLRDRDEGPGSFFPYAYFASLGFLSWYMHVLFYIYKYIRLFGSQSEFMLGLWLHMS